MVDAGYCQTMAAYNRCSIHSTLNHVLWGDRVWLGRSHQRIVLGSAYGL